MTVERAAGLRGAGVFPQWWGLPEGRSDSEERVSWVTRNIATDQGLERRGLNAAEVRSGKRELSAHAALAKVLRMKSQRLT
jgi:hypothetical protein